MLGLGTFDSKDDLPQMTDEIVSADKIHTFQKTMEMPFVTLLKENILCQHTGHDTRNIPSNDSSQIPTYGKKLIEVLLNHKGKISVLSP